MKESTFHVLVLLMVVLIFSIPFVSFSQQNSVILEARVAADRMLKRMLIKMLASYYASVLVVYFLPSFFYQVRMVIFCLQLA